MLHFWCLPDLSLQISDFKKRVLKLVVAAAGHVPGLECDVLRIGCLGSLEGFAEQSAVQLFSTEGQLERDIIGFKNRGIPVASFNSAGVECTAHPPIID